MLQESRWLVLIAIALFLGLALAGYHRSDPGWSHTMHAATLQNPTGRGGAWLADLLLYVFGLSAWWWIVLMIGRVWTGYRRLDGLRTADRRPLYIALAGFLVLIVASSGLEALRFYTLKAALPLQPGGMIGLEIGKLSLRYLGYTGATLTLLACIAVGWSLFSGMSWLTAAERVGTALELAYLGVRGLIERWQDRRIGREVAREREAVVEVEKKRVETQEPIIIEVPEPPKVVVPATSRCGILPRSTTTGCPPMSLPSVMASGELMSWYSLLEMISERRTTWRLGFGSSSAMHDLPGTVSTTRIEIIDRARAMSLARLTICAPLTPTAGSIS